MTYKTHIAGGVLVSAALASYIGQDIVVASFIGGIGGLLPDIDHKSSYIGKRLPFLSVPISYMFKHRTFTHSLLFLALLSSLLFKLNDPYFFYFLFFMAGAFSHILYDMMTPSGIPLFYPFFKKRFGFYPKFIKKIDIRDSNGFGTSLSEKIVFFITAILICLVFGTSISGLSIMEIAEKLKEITI